MTPPSAAAWPRPTLFQDAKQNVEIKGSRIAFDTICDGQTVHSVITYDGDRYAGEMTAAGMGVMALSAHRVGACPVRQGG